MTDDARKLLREAHNLITKMYFGGNPHKDLLDRITALLAAPAPEPVGNLNKE